jgi:hypothetical protein
VSGLSKRAAQDALAVAMSLQETELGGIHHDFMKILVDADSDMKQKDSNEYAHKIC